MQCKMQGYAWLDRIFLVSVFFPFVGFNAYDSQPWPFFVAATYLFVNFSVVRSTDRLSIAMAWIVYLGAVLVGVAQSFERTDFYLLRSVAMYLSVPIFYYSSLVFVRRKGGGVKAVSVVSAVWLMAGVLQLFYPALFSEVINMRTSTSRGVTSLSPEPGNFATMMIFLSLIHVLVSDRVGLLFLNVAGVLFLAKSALGVVYISLASVIYSVVFARGIVLVLFFGSLVGAFVALNFGADIESDIRMLHVLMALLSSPGSLLAEDVSTMSRLSDTVLPILVSAHHYFLPSPFNSYSVGALDFISSGGGSVFLHTGTDIIKSWHGCIIYELGFGLAPLIYIFYIQPGFRIRSRVGVVAIVVFVLSFSAIPISFPPLYFLLALLRESNLRK